MLSYHADRKSLLKPQDGDTVFKRRDDYNEDAICAEFSRLVYKRFESDASNEEYIKEALALVGFQDIKFTSGKSARANAQAIAATNPQRNLAIWAFRGTQADNPTDILSDADALPDEWSNGGKVHRGFKNAFDIVSQDLSEWASSNRGKKIIFTGHSLGAALATLAASIHHGCQLVTFGSPLVGNNAFVESVTGKCEIARYVNCCDVVTRVPPPWVFGYQHVSHPTYITKEGEIINSPATDDIESDQREARINYLLKYAWKAGNNALRDLSDHAPVNYVTALFGL
jgi:hypothetical protein